MPDTKQALRLRDYSQEKRDEMADEGVALDDGSFPIANGTDLANAVKAMGRAKDPDRVKRHIIKRARALGLVKELPESWEIKASASRVAFSVAFATDPEPEYVEKDGVKYVRGKDQQIFPRGRSRAIDGREVVLDDENGPALVNDFARREVDLAITFDHEEDKARGSEAAGWAGALEWRTDGLYATNVLWTVDAYGEITSGKWRYVSGDAYAIGYETGEPWEPESKEPAYPVRMLAFTLCPKPALQNRLKSLALATLEGVTPKAATTVGIPTKGKKMDEATMAAVMTALGVTAESSNEEVMAALKKFSAAAAPPEHEEPDGDEGCDHCSDCSGEGGCTNHEGASAELAAAVPVQTGARKKMEKVVKTEEPNVAGLVSQALAASEKRMAAKFAADVEAVRQKLKADQEAEAKKEKIGSLVLSAIRDRKIDSGEKDLWIKRLELNFDGESAELEKREARPASIDAAFSSAKFASALRISGGRDNRMPDWRKMSEADRVFALNRILFFADSRGLNLQRDDHRALAVRSIVTGEGADEYETVYSAQQNQTKFPEGLCRFHGSRLANDPSFDWDLFDRARERFRKGDGVATDRLADFHRQTEMRLAALERRHELKLATIGGLQPTAMTTIPASIGYAEGDYIADEVLENYTGGATLDANYFRFGQERFYVPRNSDGTRVATAPYTDPQITDLNATPTHVTLLPYAMRINVDSLLQDAAVALPEGLMTLASEHIDTQKKLGREVDAANFLRAPGNYTNSHTNSGTEFFNLDTGLPIIALTDQLSAIGELVGASPAGITVVSGPKAFQGIRRSKNVAEYVKFTGTLSKPGTMVPIETLIALLGCRWLVGSARDTSVPDGTPTYTWGQDIAMVVTGAGQLKAPRFGFNVVAAGYPLVRSFPMQHLGPNGADSIQVTDAYRIVAGLPAAGYLFVNATNLP